MHKCQISCKIKIKVMCEMVILNIYGKTDPICISKKLGLFISNIPSDWKSEILDECKNIIDIQSIQNKRYGYKNEIDIKKLHNSIVKDSCLNRNTTDIDYIKEIIDNMICLYFNYDYDDMPLGGWETNPFDGRLCEKDYAELIVNYWGEVYNRLMPSWIYSSNKESKDLFFKMSFFRADFDIGMHCLCFWGKQIDNFLQSRNDYLLLDYLIQNFQDDDDNVFFHFLKWYSLCQLFLEKDKESELDWKLAMFLSNEYSKEERIIIASLFRKMRNKIAHGDFLKFEELIEEYATKIMDGKFNFDYSEKSRKNWAIDHARFSLKKAVLKINSLLFSNKDFITQIKKTKNADEFMK